MRNKIEKIATKVTNCLGYKEGCLVDRHIRSYLCLRQGQQDNRAQLIVGTGILSILVGSFVSIGCFCFGLFVEGIYVGLLFFGAPFLILASYKRKALRIRNSIAMEMPKVLNLLIILLGAGLSLSSALRGVIDTQDNQGLLTKNLKETMVTVDKGMPLVMAWTNFANKCSTQETSALATLIIREGTLGSKGLVDSLKAILNASVQTRRRQVIKMGELAKTRLLIPQTMIFGAILLLIGYPAFVALG